MKGSISRIWIKKNVKGSNRPTRLKEGGCGWKEEWTSEETCSVLWFVFGVCLSLNWLVISENKVRTDRLVFLSPEQPSLPRKFIKFVFYRILCSAMLLTWRLDGAQLKLYKLRCTAGTAGSTSWHAHFSQPGPELTEKSCAAGFQRPGAGLLISIIPGNWFSWHQRWAQMGVYKQVCIDQDSSQFG